MLLQGLLAQLPHEAQALVDTANREIAEIQEQTDAEVTRLREQAERQVAEVEDQASNRRRALLRQAAEQLEPMQKDFLRAGELGKALAVFVHVQTLRCRAQEVLPDPGTLLRRYEQVGKTFHFRVTGTNEGPVWGTDLYTADSHLATAAVHAGALAPEEGVVRVSVVDMSRVAVRGSLRCPLPSSGKCRGRRRALGKRSFPAQSSVTSTACRW